MAGVKVLFIGGTRYSNPLSPTQEKKIKALTLGLDMTFIGFHKKPGKMSFRAHGDFYLMSLGIANYIRQCYFLVFAYLKGSALLKRNNISVIVCQSPFEGIAGVWLKKRFPGTKLIIEIHGEWDKAPAAYGRLPLKLKWLSDAMGSWSLRRCDALRVISETTRLTVQGFNKRTFCFPTYTDIENFLESPGRDIIFNRFIFIGQLVRLKGLDSLIEAVALLKDQGLEIELLLVGEGVEGARFKTRVKELGLEEYCQFLGRKDQDKVAELIRTSVALLLPSLTEGFGRVIIEAFACGRPAIGTRAGAIPELIKHGETGYLVAPGNSTELAARMADVMENPGYARKMGEAGQEFVIKMYSTEKYADNYIDMVQSVLEAK